MYTKDNLIKIKAKIRQVEQELENCEDEFKLEVLENRLQRLENELNNIMTFNEDMFYVQSLEEDSEYPKPKIPKFYYFGY